MQEEQTVIIPEFTGTKDQKNRAARIYQLFRARGAFFSSNAPIKVAVDDLVDYLAEHDGNAGDTADKIDKALTKNSHIFARIEDDGSVVFATTRAGTPPPEPTSTFDAKHDLNARFTTPEPPRPKTQRRAEAATFEEGAGAEEQPQDELPFPPDSWQAAVAAALREAEGEDTAEVIMEDAQSETPAEPTPAFEVEDEVAESVDDAEAEEMVVEEQPAPETEPTDLEVIDVPAATDEELAEAIHNDLGRQVEVVRWGNQWMIEENVPRLSRGDLRRLQEFISDSESPLPDEDLVQDLRGVRPNSPEFETERFALNYRLSREVRDFEYVGTAGSGLWASTQMTPIGTEKRKASEIGQDYRFLLDYRRPSEDLEEGIIEHVLTFYEYRYGVLPLDANVQTLMPEPAFADQRAARLTFESPQTSETVVAELRFPTSNRGGYIVGLEEFFETNLVPGALLTIEATDNETHFIIEYFQISRQDRKLLHLDEKKDKYVFRTTTYYCATQEDMMLTDNDYDELENKEPLEERVRRRPEQVVAATLERIGDQVTQDGEQSYRASFTDILAVANIERPISEQYLRDILTAGTYSEFVSENDEEDIFIYIPSSA